MELNKLMEPGYYSGFYCVYMNGEVEGVYISSPIIPAV